MENDRTEKPEGERWKRLVVEWKTEGASGTDTGVQSRQMMGAAESGCCRQGGSPCSPKKFS